MKRFSLWFILIIVLVCVYFDLPKIDRTFTIPGTPIKLDGNSLLDKFPLKLGLDLQGGSQLVLQTDMSNIPADQRKNALESAKNVIERRVNLYGVSEAVVQTSTLGEERRILVDIPGIKDASAAANLVGKTAKLDFREVSASGAAIPANIPPALATNSAFLNAYALQTAQPTGLSGADLKKAEVSFSQSKSAKPQVLLTFTEEGARKFADISRRNVGKQLPIFLDDEIVTAPVIQQEILGGSAVITGDYTTATAKQLTVQLNAGALPVPIKILEQRSIGASLGAESINKSIFAAIVGIVIVMLYMIAFYGVWGLIADLALVIYALISLTTFKTGLFIFPPITLTLAGIAGFILSIGMAVDANILIFERMKEEIRWGKSKRVALELGFTRAWSSIRDSNVSSLITAAILFFIGTGSVQGFALTLALGVLVSMFTAVVISRTLLRLIIR